MSLKIIKWAYKLGYERGRNEIIRVIEEQRNENQYYAHVKSLEAQQDHGYDLNKDRVVTHKDHEQRRIALERTLNRIDPEKYPDIDSFLEFMR